MSESSAKSVSRIWQERWIFLKNFLRNPLQNASVIPSSRAAGRAILADIDWKQTRIVVELGPGNGTFTREILKNCMPNTTIILIELEPTYVKLLQRKFGDKVHIVHDSAHRLEAILNDFGFDHCDLLLSSLPFLPNEIRTQIDRAIIRQTSQGAVFRFFTYMPLVMRHYYRDMPIRKTNFAFWNFPPMWIFGIN